MDIETIHLSQKAKDQLIKLKRATGIQNWNVLCRWGFCISLADKTPPVTVKLPSESAIEMTWKVFGGQSSDIYLALLRQRCHIDGVSVNRETLNQQLKLHLHRGIAKLSGSTEIKKIENLFPQRSQ